MLAELLDAIDPIASDDGGEPFLGQEFTKQFYDAGSSSIHRIFDDCPVIAGGCDRPSSANTVGEGGVPPERRDRLASVAPARGHRAVFDLSYRVRKTSVGDVFRSKQRRSNTRSLVSIDDAPLRPSVR